jgi:hypothetical protein
MRHETAEEFTATARRLTEAALRVGGNTEDNNSHFRRCMAEAKAQRMT